MDPDGYMLRGELSATVSEQILVLLPWVPVHVGQSPILMEYGQPLLCLVFM